MGLRETESKLQALRGKSTEAIKALQERYQLSDGEADTFLTYYEDLGRSGRGSFEHQLDLVLFRLREVRISVVGGWSPS